jgi:hypothetical protein
LNPEQNHTKDNPMLHLLARYPLLGSPRTPSAP